MQKFVTFSLTVLVFVSCVHEQKFDKAKWSVVDDLMTFPNRRYMIDDLIENYPLTGKKYSHITDLLGNPQGGDLDSTYEVFYNIDVDYGHDIDPVYVKTLKILFDKDSIVTKIEVNEFKH